MEPYRLLLFMSTQRVIEPSNDVQPSADDVTVERGRPSGPHDLFEMAISAIILILGALEGWYKRTDFSTDAISYLDISRAIPLKDWKMIFNPLWSVGYPVLLAAARPFFPGSEAGEWLSIHVVNFFIFVCAWFAFLFLLRTLESANTTATPQESPRTRRFLFLCGASVFVSIQLCIDSVSRVGPDLMVTAFFFTATALVLRLVARPSYKHAVLLGLNLGFGYWTKGIFLALAAVLLVVAAAALIAKKRNLVPLLLAGCVFGVIITPCVAGLSWSYGEFTFGESGPLNYAFHVNLLPRWTNWQGEPGGYGKPIHPTQQLLQNPDIFSFAEPYHNTYPPFGNIAYWYRGYRHFWSARYQAIGIARDLDYLVHALIPQPIFYAVLLASVLILISTKARTEWLRMAGAYWPFFIPALVGILLYVQVHLEDRYLGSFLAILCLLPFVVTARLLPKVPGRMQMLALAILIVGAALNFLIVDRDVIAHIRNHYTYEQNSQWKLGLAMERAGMRPGDEIAVVGGPNASCTWAYIAHLRIVAELGGEPFDQRHPVPPGTESPIEAFWHSSSKQQGEVVDIFRQTGVRAAIASGKPAEISAPAGWHLLPGTDTWIYRFR